MTQVAPNSSGRPNRLDGLLDLMSLITSSIERFEFAAKACRLDFSRSVSNVPGSRLLIVTLCSAVARARPATNPVRLLGWVQGDLRAVESSASIYSDPSRIQVGHL